MATRVWAEVGRMASSLTWPTPPQLGNEAAVRLHSPQFFMNKSTAGFQSSGVTQGSLAVQGACVGQTPRASCNPPEFCLDLEFQIPPPILSSYNSPAMLFILLKYTPNFELGIRPSSQPPQQSPPILAKNSGFHGCQR